MKDGNTFLLFCAFVSVEAIEMNEIPEIQILKSTSTSTEEDESKKSYFNKYGWL